MQLAQLGQPIAWGHTAVVYRYGNEIVKVFKEWVPAFAARYEGEKQKVAYELGLPVPQVINIIDIEGQSAIMMSYVSGSPIGNLMQANPQQASYYISRFVAAQLDMHRTSCSSLELMTEKLSRNIGAAEHLSQQEKDALLMELKAISFVPVVCHGDFHPHNVLLDGDDVTVIDWIDASAGDFRADVYRSFLLMSAHSVELAERYIALYCKESGASRDEIFEWAPIIAAARLSENHSAAEIQRLLRIVQRKGS